MSPARKLRPVSVADYLAGELNSPVRHEFVNGWIEAMSGGTLAHARIAGNIYKALSDRLPDGPCEAFNSDAKVKLKSNEGTWFYYPDASVSCSPGDQEETYLTSVTAVFEVLSPSTRRIDQGEKKAVYLAHPPLAVYALVETDEPRVTVFRRAGEEFVTEEYEGLDAVLPLPEIGAELPLAEIYRRVEFSPAGE